MPRRRDPTRASVNEERQDAMTRRIAQAVETDRKERTKHPDFDRHWEKFGPMCWWFAHKAVKFFHHNEHAKWRGEMLFFGGHTAEEYVGQIVLRMNRCLYTFDESKGFNFGTYFGMNLYSELWRHVCRFNSTLRDMSVDRTTLRSRKHDEQIDLELADFDHSKRFYIIPDTDWDFVHQIIDSFDDMQDLWRFITRNMDNKRKWILYATYKKGINSEGLSQRLGLSRERIRQLLESAKQKVREQLKKLENFVRLFRLEEGEEGPADLETMSEVLDGGKKKGFSEPKHKNSTVSDDVWFEVTSFFDTPGT